GLYDPHLTLLLQRYIDALEGKLRGFSPAAMGYLRFVGDVDPSSLPASPAATLDARASVQIVDVDPRSPARGQGQLAQLYWRKSDGVYWLRDTLAVGPALGAPLRPSTRYAIVVTRSARATDGSPVTPSADLEEVLDLRPPGARTRAVHDLFAPAI